MVIKDLLRLSSAATALLVPASAMAGELTVYTPWPDHQIFALQDALDAEGMDIQIEFYRASGVEMNATFANEQTAGLAKADFVMADVDDMAHHKEAGYLLHRPLPNAADYVPSAIDPDGFWVPLTYSPFFMAYNTNLIAPEDKPTSWADMADPRYRNLIAMADPRTAVAVQYPLTYWTTVLAEEHGEDEFGWGFIDRLAEQEPMLATGHSQLVDMLIRGEAGIIPIMLNPVLAPLMNGEPVGIALAEEGAPISLVAGAVVHNAPNMEDAVRLFDWFASVEGQQFLDDINLPSAHLGIDQVLPDGTDLRQYNSMRLPVAEDVRASNTERVIAAFGL